MPRNKTIKIITTFLGTVIASAFIFCISAISAYSLDTSGWYQYNGYSNIHSFAVFFPPDWQARTSGDELQKFGPKNDYVNTYFSIQEFEGQTYEQTIDYFVDENTQLVDVKDTVFSTGDDLLAKRAIYKDINENKQYARTFIKRGSLILVLTDPNLEGELNYPVPSKYNEIVKGIYESFSFTDGWFQYIDYGEKYTFIFPSGLEINTLSDGVTLTNNDELDSNIFSVIKYDNTSIDNAPNLGEGYNENLLKTEDIIFHGIEDAILATYYDKTTKKELSKIYVAAEGDSYGLTNINIESNFPHMNYYDDYIVEILESFEFFNIEGEYYTYNHFPDVRENHPNQVAIDYLADKEIIAGYPDGTFQPDGLINRAELTKLVVESITSPDPQIYKDCFPDVNEEWFAPYICYAEEKGWVEGYPDGRFKPERNINRVETMKIVLEVLFGTVSETEMLKKTAPLDMELTDWYGKYFIFADNRSLLDKQHIVDEEEGYYFLPSQNSSRKEVAEMIYRSIKIKELLF